jgi:hypothetical protein
MLNVAADPCMTAKIKMSGCRRTRQMTGRLYCYLLSLLTADTCTVLRSLHSSDHRCGLAEGVSSSQEDLRRPFWRRMEDDTARKFVFSVLCYGGILYVVFCTSFLSILTSALRSILSLLYNIF